MRGGAAGGPWCALPPRPGAARASAIMAPPPPPPPPSRSFMAQGGDITLGNGMGGESIYGETFEARPGGKVNVVNVNAC